MKTNKLKRILITLVALLLVGAGTYKGVLYMQSRKAHAEQVAQKEKLGKAASFTLDEQKMKNIKNIMIVAHPDDETLWGGAHLNASDKYLVLCLTNGNNPVRKKEFEEVMKRTGNYGVILNYPDNPNNVKSKWINVKDDIKEDVAYALFYKNYDMVVTHNPQGEYGHMHHRFTSLIVTRECDKLQKSDVLYYFNHYSTPNAIRQSKMKPILNEEQIAQKRAIMEEVYKSQSYAYSLFKEMVPYESFIRSEDWYFTK